MKRYFSLLLLVFLHFAKVQAQVPQLINYQAVARDASGNALAARTVSLRMSILDNTATGVVVYQETFSVTTDQNGLFNLAIGGGNVVSGVFASINWGVNNKFLRTEIDPAGGSTYIVMGTSQLLSVPYALYSRNSADGGLWSLTGSNIHNSNTGNVGIGTALPTARLHVQFGSTLFTGYQPVSLPTSPGLAPGNGAGSRQFWYLDKSAFRTGGIDDNSYGSKVWQPIPSLPNGNHFWDKDSIGQFSFGAGYNVLASGIGAFSVGAGNRARGNFSVAGGDNNQSTGVASTVFGESNLATADAAVALGAVDTASNFWAAAIGFRNAAKGEASFAAGSVNKALGLHSTAFGENNRSAGRASFVAGGSNIVSGDYGTAAGDSNLVIGNSAFAAGTGNILNGFANIALGIHNTTQGDDAISIGEGNSSSGLIGISLGVQNTSNNAIAIGVGNHADGSQAAAIGSNNTATSSAIALGQSCSATGNSAFAAGFSNTASGANSIAAGESSKATADNSIAMGILATAGGARSIAIGTGNIASGLESTALGCNMNTANHTGTFMIGDASPVDFGQYTNAGTDNQFIGRFAGGYYLISMDDLGGTRTGVQLLPNGNGWSTISDSTKKRHFVKADEEAMLRKLAGFSRLGTWSYKGQDPAQYRHYGPMAQDFYNAFGHDGVGTIGNDTLINSPDMQGVLFTVAHALTQRTDSTGKMITVQQHAMEQIVAENAALKQQLAMAEQQHARDMAAIDAQHAKDMEAVKQQYAQAEAALNSRMSALSAQLVKLSLLVEVKRGEVKEEVSKK